MPMVEREPSQEQMDEIDRINGLTEKEKRELRGVINPSETIDKSTRPESLKIQLDHIKKNTADTKKLIENTIDKTYEERDNTDNPENIIELEERIISLTKARDLTIEQMEKEEVREQQEEEISRLQRFKEWAKENMLRLSALAISIAGIITTIIVSARKAILSAARATGKFAKALYNLSKKIGSNSSFT